jgi:hypothetical protein
VEPRYRLGSTKQFGAEHRDDLPPPEKLEIHGVVEVAADDVVRETLK